MACSTLCCTGLPPGAQAGKDVTKNLQDIPDIAAEVRVLDEDPMKEERIIGAKNIVIPGFDGTWVDTASGYQHYHIIEQDKLTWADRTLTMLTIEPQQVKEFSMEYNGKMISASLDLTGNKLEWSDGDTWKRAGLDGMWKEGLTGLITVIEGSFMRRTQGTKLDSKLEPLTPLDEFSFELVIDGQTHKATLDQSGQMLRWNDGDTWKRLSSLKLRYPPKAES